MRFWILAFTLGAVAGGFIPALPGYAATLLLWLPLLLTRQIRVLSLAAAFCLGIWWLLVQAIAHQRNILPADLEQQELWISGSIIGLPQSSQRSTRFVFVSDGFCAREHWRDCNAGENRRPQKLLLNDYDGRAYLPGQAWLLKVRLKRPHGFANPGTFDYESWLFQERITATGYVREAVPQGRVRPSLTGMFNQLRFEFLERLESGPLEAAGFMAALTIGHRPGISDEQWQLMSQTGTNHLMVISGLHIGLVAWLVYRCCMVLFRLWPGLGLVMPVSRLAALAAITAAFCYAGLAGFSLPVKRAFIMVSCLMCGQLLVRQTHPVNNLCLALLLVLLLDPLAPQSAGFWLSFLAVALLLTALLRPPEASPAPLFAKIRDLVHSQFRLFLGLAPLMLLLFRQVSLLAPLVNLVAIPFIGLLVVPLCLLALVSSFVMPGAFVHLISLPDFLLGRYQAILETLVRSLHFLLVQFPAPPPALLVLLAIILGVHLYRARLLTGISLVLVLAWVHTHEPARPDRGEFVLDVLDVGQGLAAIVTTREHLLVFDTGPAYSPRFNAGGGIVQPFLRGSNLGDPDKVVVSHGDSDHAGGLAALKQFYPQADYISGEDSAATCRAGQSWQWDGVRFVFLHPAADDLSGNNASCVLKISAGSHSVLLPGDIEQDAELELIRRYRETLRADILVAPHHGSRTSSTPPFIRFVGPRHVVFTAGYLNRFNHPHPDVLARYTRQNSDIHTTSASGAIRFHVSARKGVNGPEYYRQSRPRFWSAME